MREDEDKRRHALGLVEAKDWSAARVALTAYLRSGDPEAEKDFRGWLGLSQALAALGEAGESERALFEAYSRAPKEPEVAVVCANHLSHAGDHAQASKVVMRALAAHPQNIHLLKQLADIYEISRRYPAALKTCAEIVRLAPDDAGPRLKAGWLRMRMFDTEGAATEFAAVLEKDPNSQAALEGLASAYRVIGRVEEAFDLLQRRAALERDPGAAALFRFKADSIQPILARSEAESEAMRTRYVAALRSGPAAPIDDPFRAGLGPNFFLNYQARNDRDCVRGLAAYHLAATPSLAMMAPHVGQSATGRRIRVGIVGAFFSKHTVGYLSLGLISALDRSRFDLTLFRVPTASRDPSAAPFEAAAPCVDLPDDLHAARLVIAGAKLDIVHFPEIGMDHFTYFLAFARLGTLQTTSWGHPVSTGIPNIDLFLSVDDMEPPNASEHYTEQMVRLKNLSFAGAIPPVAVTSKTVAGLDPGPAYLCAQSLYKVHPRFDAIVARILRADAEAMIYFLSMGAYVDKRFLDRLRDHAGDACSRVRILPRTTASGFLKLVGAADVALDVPEWSGGKTSLETFRAGVPVVHMPGEFMRGRHTLAFYRRMEIGAAIVHSDEAYTEMAVRLVHDLAFRKEMQDQIQEASPKLFEDWNSIREIEQVWTAALGQRAAL